ncbi:MAG TPA: cob(I)yrinic acid a,c-diamide adenosyltransferase [Verrucomicrobiales bacterium]|nr:cob(I)yrinic acid a,c-diamide adenosyltransferase [Verrucomicrobiales bacterium]HIL68656.1 cob(I)yrinic acid a,c-diamide adenosyltransferase [Verrucomicrobiota bacterium]
MSITTRTGDDGTTALMFGRRASKSNPVVEAIGSVDELNAAIGLARASSRSAEINGKLQLVQKDLIILMGELSVDHRDRERYLEKGYSSLSFRAVECLDQWIEEIESQALQLKGWVLPGSREDTAALDWARVVCRRSERTVHGIDNEKNPINKNIRIYLNRLADFLWVAARQIEKEFDSSDSEIQHS